MRRFTRVAWAGSILASLLLLGGTAACTSSDTAGAAAGDVAGAGSRASMPDAQKLMAQARAIFGELPAEAPSATNPTSESKTRLGRMLYFDQRLSKNHDVSCNSCHDLATFGQDNQPNSPGHRGQRGGRSSPTAPGGSSVSCCSRSPHHLGECGLGGSLEPRRSTWADPASRRQRW